MSCTLKSSVHDSAIARFLEDNSDGDSYVERKDTTEVTRYTIHGDTENISSPQKT
jgi:hypothetical protein